MGESLPVQPNYGHVLPQLELEHGWAIAESWWFSAVVLGVCSAADGGEVNRSHHRQKAGASLPFSPVCASWMLNQCKAGRFLGRTAPFYFYCLPKGVCPPHAVSSYPFPGRSPMRVFLQLRSQPSVLPVIPGQPDRCLPAPRSTELLAAQAFPSSASPVLFACSRICINFPPASFGPCRNLLCLPLELELVQAPASLRDVLSS